jgi:hypothetical protein
VEQQVSLPLFLIKTETDKRATFHVAPSRFAEASPLRAFFVVAEANRTKRRATSNSRSSTLNPSSSKPNIRPAAEASFPPIILLTGPPTNVPSALPAIGSAVLANGFKTPLM